MTVRTALPDFELVWPRIQRRARELQGAGQPVRTLKEGFRNYIEDVSDEGITRRSERTRTGTSSVVRKAEFKAIWEGLGGHRDMPQYPTVFVFALMLEALDDLVERDGNAIRPRLPR